MYISFIKYHITHGVQYPIVEIKISTNGVYIPMYSFYPSGKTKPLAVIE